jgi:hypothetical protein
LRDYEQVVKLLLDAGANVEAQGSSSHSSQHWTFDIKEGIGTALYNWWLADFDV